MKINMAIVADWLSKFNIRQDIKQGSNPIHGVRFFMGDLPDMKREFVYVGHAIDVFADPQFADSVLLLNEYDMVFVHGESMETIINSLLACIDFYSAWEVSLKEKAFQPDCISGIVQSFSEVFQAKVALLDMKGTVLAVNCPNGESLDDYIAQSILETSAVPQSILFEEFYDESDLLVKDLTDQPQIYHADAGWRIIGNYIRVGRERTGVLIFQECKRRLTRGDCSVIQQLMPVLCNAIEADGHASIQSISALYQNLIQGDCNPDAVDALTQRLVKGSGRMPWTLFLFRCAGNGYQVGTGRLCELLQRISSSGITAEYEGDILSLVRGEDVEFFLKSVNEAVLMDQFFVGISLPFSDLAELRTAYRQTVFAAEYCSDTGVRFTRNLAFPYLINRMKDHSRELELYHPASTILGGYDSEKGSELYKTLIVFLENERNITNTAKSLFIHRNTLATRIERIQQLLDSDLNDPMERMFILFSEYMK